MEKEVIQSAFSINPSTVYGFLVALLVLAVLVLAWQYSKQTDKFVELLTQNIKVIETFSSYINKENIEVHKNDLVVQLREEIREETKLVLDALEKMKR